MSFLMVARGTPNFFSDGLEGFAISEELGDEGATVAGVEFDDGWCLFLS